jgi:hypothetical protein
LLVYGAGPVYTARRARLYSKVLFYPQPGLYIQSAQNSLTSILRSCLYSTEVALYSTVLVYTAQGLFIQTKACLYDTELVYTHNFAYTTQGLFIEQRACLYSTEVVYTAQGSLI